MKRILAIGAHPDDIEYGTGGTLFLLKEKFEIHMLVMTYGEVGASHNIRKKEQLKAAKYLNAKVYWGNFKDTQVETNRNTILKIEEIIRNVDPHLIFVNYYNDTHQDHRNTSISTITASRYIRNVLFYEVPTSIDFIPNIFMDIGKVIDEKIKLLKAHKSQVYATRVPHLDILESAKSAAIFRGFQNRVKYAEGFLSVRFSLDCFL
jgi:LmbE family N-acetylglucosaminyl deacetylase